MSKLEFSSLYHRTKQVILEMIKSNSFTGNKLPPEDELAREIGVSLSTVREALLMLTREGVITKKHGLGNFVHRSALQAKMRVDLVTDFIELLEGSGYEVRLVQSGFRMEEADALIAQRLHLEEREELLTYTRSFYAGEELAIHSLNRIPSRLLVKTTSDAIVERTIYDFVWKYCQEDLAHSILEFVPHIAEENEQRLFDLPKSTAMIVWEEIFYNLQDQPVCFNHVFFNPNIVKMKMLRKWG